MVIVSGSTKFSVYGPLVRMNTLIDLVVTIVVVSCCAAGALLFFVIIWIFAQKHRSNKRKRLEGSLIHSTNSTEPEV